MILAATAEPSLLVTVGLPALVSLVTTLLVSGVGWWWTLRQRRRAEQARLYADAYTAVRAYKEFPYVVRRRNAEDPAGERLRISEALRTIQQDLAFHAAWITLHSPAVAQAFDALVSETRRVAGGLIQQAWTQPGIDVDADMNVPDIGPQLATLADVEEAFLTAVASEFGRSRAPAPVRSA